MVVASLPTLTLNAALTTKPTASPTWTDLSDRLRATGTLRVVRGRQTELDVCQPGRLDVLLGNRDRELDPENAAGSYYGNLLPRKRVQLLATWDGIEYPVYAGYVWPGWAQSWPARNDAVVPLRAVDGLDLLARRVLSTSYAEERSDERIGELITGIGWETGLSWVLGSTSQGVLGTSTILAPNGDRLLSEGQATVQASTLSEANALTHAQDVERTEGGLLFIDRQGVVVFHSRHRSLTYPFNVSAATFGDSSAELFCSAIRFDSDPKLYNEVSVTRTGGAIQTASSTASQDDYFVSTLSRSGVLYITDALSLDAATFWLNSYKDPHAWVRSITVLPQRDPANLWPAVLNRELGDRITVIRRPPGGGDAIEQDCLIQGITHQLSGSLWTTTFALSPAVMQGWVLGSETQSILGTSTRLYW